MKTATTCIAVGLVAAALAAPAAAQQTTFKDVKTRFNRSADDPRLIDKNADLILDDTARRMIVQNSDHPLDVGYDDIQRIVFDVSTHMRGGALGGLVGGLAGAAISAKHVNDYWCYVEYQTSRGTVETYMLEIAQEASPQVIDKMQALFGDKVSIPTFDEKPEDIEKNTLADLQSKHDMKVDKANHPMPRPEQGKALVVVVCPALAARDAGKGNQVKLHANDRVVLVNKMGTYGFVNLEPGTYRLVSQTGNASGFTITLEADTEYYFLQDTFTGMMKSGTQLSRHSKELVMHELSGAYLSDWTRK